MKNTNEKIHAKHSPSKYPALLACPCFESKPPSADTFKGTDVHAKLEEFLNILKQGDDLSGVDTNTLDCFERGAFACATYVMQTCDDATQILVEERIEINADTWGWCDCAWTEKGENGDKVVVLDFKTFKNSNRVYGAQLAGYAYGLFKRNRNIVNCELVTFYGDGTYTSYEMHIDEVFDLMEKISKIIKSEDKKPTCCGWCDLCAKNGCCEAFQALALSVKDKEMQELSTSEKWSLQEPEKKVNLLLIAEMCEKWAKAIKDLAKADLESGAMIKDDNLNISYVLTNVRGKLVPNTAKACAMLVEQGVDVNTIKEHLTISATDIKALLKNKGFKGKALDELIEAVSERGAGSSKMEKK